MKIQLDVSFNSLIRLPSDTRTHGDALALPKRSAAAAAPDPVCGGRRPGPERHSPRSWPRAECGWRVVAIGGGPCRVGNLFKQRAVLTGTGYPLITVDNL
jgi:hypothetical protein